MTRLTAKQKQRLYNLLTQGRRGVEIAKRLNIDPKVIYYHQKKFLRNNYIDSIGADKPTTKQEVGQNLIVIGELISKLGRNMCGDHSV